MKHLPTDFQILNAIYNRYYKQFTQYSIDNKIRRTKNYVPIDISQIASDMNVDKDIIFGRLYYHFQQKYGYKRDDGIEVPFFALSMGNPSLDNPEIHCINFPYMSSVLASLRDEDRKYRIAISFSITSLFISILSCGISIYRFILPDFRTSFWLPVALQESIRSAFRFLGHFQNM